MNLTLPKTFNNHVSFERGLWQRQSRQFEHVPKTDVFDINPIYDVVLTYEVNLTLRNCLLWEN